MTRRTFDDRRDTAVAAVTPGPASSPHVPTGGDRVDLPAVLVVALEAAGTSIADFLHRLGRGSIWQDEAIRSVDREIEIQAYLPPEGLRCMIRIGRSIYYHHPLRTFHVHGMLLPAVDVGDGVPLNCILPHRLLDTIPIRVTRIRHLNSITSDLGICIHVSMPTVSIVLPHIRS